MKKITALLMSAVMVASLAAGCGNVATPSTSPTPSSSATATPSQSSTPSSTPAGETFKAGMVTDSGTIDDKSFNQGSWEGIVKAADELGLEKHYIKPAGETEADYLTEIGNLYDSDFKFIVCPGFMLTTAVFAAQDQYPDAKFVLIDAVPNNGKYGDEAVEKIGSNTVAILYKEQESGFMAGVATALQIKEGDVGFIGGMEIPAVQKFNWGFQQGVKYANDNYSTKITIKQENVVYQGTFNEIAAGQQLAAQMYDRGVKAIFAAAGSVGLGVINEAITRTTAGKESWVIGVDVDQYNDGLLADKSKSVILTSATKGVRIATYDMIKAHYEGTFPGGQVLTYEAANDGVGLPDENPNLSADVQKTASEVFAKIKSGEIKVADTGDGLIK